MSFIEVKRFELFGDSRVEDNIDLEAQKIEHQMAQVVLPHSLARRGRRAPIRPLPRSPPTQIRITSPLGVSPRRPQSHRSTLPPRPSRGCRRSQSWATYCVGLFLGKRVKIFFSILEGFNTAYYSGGDSTTSQVALYNTSQVALYNTQHSFIWPRHRPV